MSAEAKYIAHDRADWLSAALYAFFLALFPIVLWMIWNEPRQAIPLYIALPFTLLFVACVPFLWRGITRAQSTTITFDSTSGTLVVRRWQPFNIGEEALDARAVKAVIFEESDNDGYWYRGLIDCGAEEPIVFVQGSHLRTVRDETEQLTNLLRQHAKELRIIDRSV